MPDLKDHDCKNYQLPFNPDAAAPARSLQSMGPDGIYLRIPKELADVITKPLLIIFERSWESREVPPDWKLTNLAQVF